MPFYNVTSVTLSPLNSINAIEVECPLVHWGYLWDIFGISLGYLWDILGISWGYFGDILGISWGYLGDILAMSWGYLGNILGISWEYLGDHRFICPLVHWSIGPLVHWSIGPLRPLDYCHISPERSEGEIVIIS